MPLLGTGLISIMLLDLTQFHIEDVNKSPRWNVMLMFMGAAILKVPVYGPTSMGWPCK